MNLVVHGHNRLRFVARGTTDGVLRIALDILGYCVALFGCKGRVRLHRYLVTVPKVVFNGTRMDLDKLFAIIAALKNESEHLAFDLLSSHLQPRVAYPSHIKRVGRNPFIARKGNDYR